MSFKIWGVNDTTWQTPDIDAKPLIEAPPVLTHPPHMGKDGNAKPVAAVGLPTATVGRNSINQSGLTWWNSRYGTNVEPGLVKVILYDTRKATWGTYQAYMEPYTWDGATPWSTPKVNSFRVRFFGIQTTT